MVKHIEELRAFLANNEIYGLAINKIRLDAMLLLVTTKYIYMVTKLFVVTENSTVDLVMVFAFIFVIPLIFLFDMICRLINWKIYVFRLRNINRNLFSYQPGIGRQDHLLKSSNTSSHFLVDLTQKILSSIF